jgi:uncharacterized membrane protein
MQLIVRLFLILVALCVFSAVGVFVLSFIARAVLVH